MSACVVITRNYGPPSVIGPFDDTQTAAEYAKVLKDGGVENLWVAQINPPGEAS